MARTDRSTCLAALAATTFAAAMLTGCASFIPRESPLPRDGATMTDVYRSHMGTEASGQTVRDRLPQRGADEDAIVSQRKALSDPLNNRFERLPNPDLTMHVFPHLSKGKYPVPGYDTVFPMYQGVEYALPGEVAPRYSAGLGTNSNAPDPAPRSMSDDAARKARRLDELGQVAPRHARALIEYDRLHARQCGRPMTSTQLFAVPASGEPAFERLLAAEASAVTLDPRHCEPAASNGTQATRTAQQPL